MSIKGLPVTQRSKVFRRICDQLMTDPTLSNVVKEWDTWDGQADHASSVVPLDPMIRLTPKLGPQGWYSPDSHVGPLEIQIEMGVNSFDAADCLDLWGAFERAIYPFDDRDKQLAFEQELSDLGCEPQQITFSNPASIQSASGGQFLCIGSMYINIVRLLTP